MRLQRALSVSPVHSCDFGPPLKRLSVSRCPRDDMDRIRLPDDLPEEIRTECHRPDIPSGRHSGAGRNDLRGGDEHREK